ncbi:uncharacterized protein LOC135225772 [Macrobrachium nipponense]|uniref:uncharacterized protein LOC135225772 n=1 Tax=Macrobrachium nipponense TaxID=159736 RepID=UPI0030C884DD
MASGFSEDDFVYSKYLKCVLVFGCQVVQDVVRGIYSRRSMRTRNGTMPVRHFNMRANVDPYFADMSHFLDSNLMEESFDISFGYKLLTEKSICGEMFLTFSEESQKQMNYIVGQRNKICHTYGEISDFEVKVTKLKTYITDIYKEANQKLSIDFDSNCKDLVEKIDETVKAKKTDPLGINCLDCLEKFMDSLRFKMLNRGKVELFEYYETLKILSPCTWIDDEDDRAKRFDIEKIFTPPKIWQHRTKINIGIKDLLTFKKAVPKILLIKGLAGSGKTSLCRYLVHCWYKKIGAIDLLKDFDLVILIEIRRSSSVTLLEYLCEELLSDTCFEFQPKDVIPLMQEMDLLFIIDGYDEDSTKAGALLEDILNHFHDKRILVTSRLSYENEIRAISEEFLQPPLILTLEGFEESEQKAFAEKVFKADDSNGDGFLMYLNGRGRVLNKHLKLPLTISLLIVLWIEKPEVVNKVTTATNLYHEIFTLYQEKLTERLITNLKGRRGEELKRKIPSLLLMLGDQAWFLLTQGNGCCDLSSVLREKLEGKCNEKGIDPTEFLSAFLMCEIHDSNPKKNNSAKLGGKYCYSFIHRTQMEYLAADFLAESCKKDSSTLLRLNQEVSDWRKHSEVLVYLIGNLAKKNILKGKESEFLKLTEQTENGSTDFCYWWKIISESRIIADIPDSPGKPILYRKIEHPYVAQTIYDRHLSNNSEWHLNNEDVAAGLRLMSLVNPYCLSATALVIDIPHGIDPVNIPDFYDALSAVEFHWRQKKQKKKVKVALHFHDHDNSSNTESTSDRYLLLLNNWAELQNFSGSLKEATSFFSEGYMKTLRCLVTTPDVLRSFENLPNSVRNLRLTLGFPPDSCTPEDLKEIDFRGELELFIPYMHDEYLNWLIKVVRKLSNGDLKKLHLEHSSLTHKASCI